MDRLALVGAAVTLVALLGYAVGTATPYPGRAFSVTGVMLGLALLVIGLARGEEAVA